MLARHAAGDGTRGSRVRQRCREGSQRGRIQVSAPYDDGPLPDETEIRQCMLCLRNDCPGHFLEITAVTLTDDHIYDTVTSLLIPFTPCWIPFDVPVLRRDKASAHIAMLLEQERK